MRPGYERRPSNAAVDPDDYDTVGLDNIQISKVQRVVIVVRIINKFLGVPRHPSD